MGVVGHSCLEEPWNLEEVQHQQIVWSVEREFEFTIFIYPFSFSGPPVLRFTGRKKQPTTTTTAIKADTREEPSQ
jgi:hypothetical protein